MTVHTQKRDDGAPLHSLTATETLVGLSCGAFTAADVARTLIGRVQQRERDVRAWAWFDANLVMDRIGALAALPSADHPLAGLCIGIKDIFDTADMPTQYGSCAYSGHRPAADAAAVSRLRQAGAIAFGKTVTAEFAYLHPGPTRNPQNTAYSAGGSSSGSAAAVADCMVPVALGSQSGGSTIRPASYCGVLGFKPTIGAVDRAGMMPLSGALDTVGFFARCMDDIQLLYATLGCHPALAAPFDKPLRGCRIGYYPGPYADAASADARRVLEETKGRVEALGATVTSIDLPEESFGRLSDINRIFMAYDGAHVHRDVYLSDRDKLGKETVALIERGLQISKEDYGRALAEADQCLATFEHAMTGYDALMTYAAPGEAPLFEEGTGSSIFNRQWTTLGVPCLALPFGRGSHHMPIGVQLVSIRGSDLALLALGKMLESALLPPTTQSGRGA